MFFLFFVSLLAAQGGGRFEEAKRMAMAYLGSEQYDKAAGRLEEVWEQDQSDPTVGEYLALAYLNTEDRQALPRLEKQATVIIEQLFRSRLRVSFMVHHCHEKAAWLQGRQWNQYCSGRLSFGNGRFVYLAQKGKDAQKHSFDIPSSELKAIFLDNDPGRGVFHIKSPQGSYVMASRNRNPNEAKLLVEFAKKLKR